MLRRYCAANGLNRLGTLTYRGEGCHDQRQVRADLGVFMRLLRRRLGDEPMPYAWVPEWHKSGHGLHAHFAVGRYIKRGLIEEAWGHGFVSIKMLGDLPVGSGQFEEARQAGRYLAKYVGKDFGGRDDGLHRYEVAQRFQPEFVAIQGRSVDQVLDIASQQMGGTPHRVWQSQEVEEWQGPPVVSASWR